MGRLVGARRRGASPRRGSLRRLAGPARLARAADLLDGLTVVNLVVFAIAIMDGVNAFARERPGFVAIAVAAAFGTQPRAAGLA